MSATESRDVRKPILECISCGNTTQFLAKAAFHVDKVDGYLNVIRVDYSSYEEYTCCHCGADVNASHELADECFPDR